MPSLQQKLLLFSGGGAFSPLNISGLVAWYDAADAATLWEDSAGTIAAADNADVIGRWSDKSGNGRHYTQTTTAVKPTLRTNVQNGKSIVRADGINDYLQTAVFTLNQPASHYIVYKQRTLAAGADIVLDGVSAANTYLVDGSGIVLNAGTGITNAYIPANNVFALVRVDFNGASSKLIENNVTKLTGNAGALNPSGLTLAALRNGTRPVAIDVAEHLVYNRILSAGEDSATLAYLNAKWAVY